MPLGKDISHIPKIAVALMHCPCYCIFFFEVIVLAFLNSYQNNSMINKIRSSIPLVHS